MSRATADIMRRAFRFCSQRVSGYHHLIPASLKNISKPYQRLPKPRLAFHFPVRVLSGIQARSEDYEKLVPSPPPDLTPLPKQAQSAFMDKLYTCNSPADVLDLTSQFAPTVRQVSSCLSQMWNCIKKMSEDQRRFELRLMMEHQGFEKFLTQAMSSIEGMGNRHLAYSLLALVKLGVSPQTRVVQTFLRAAQERINDFDEKSLSILTSCLEDMKNTANVRALKDGIMLLVESRLPRINNVVHLQTLMRLVGKDAPIKLKLKLVAKALSMSEQFTLPNAQYMVSTMAAMGLRSRPLLSICSKKIIENLDGIPFNCLLKVLVSCKDLKFRDPQMLDAVSEYSASMVDVWTNKQMVLLLSALKNLSYCSSALMEAYSKKVISNPAILTLEDLRCVLRVYATLNYSSQQNRFLETLVEALDPYLLKMSPVQLLKAVFDLCLLGHFPQAPLQLLLQDSTLQQLNKDCVYVQRGFGVVDLCLRLDRPVLPDCVTVPPSVLSCPEETAVPKPHLSAALHTLMEESVMEEWRLENGVVLERLYVIDAVLTKNVPVSGESPSVDRPHRIAVLCVPQSKFCFGTSQLRGFQSMKLRHLRILGYSPVLVPEEELLPLSEKERVEFIRDRIFTKNTDLLDVKLEPI